MVCDTSHVTVPLQGRITHCSQSVCPSVRLSRTCLGMSQKAWVLWRYCLSHE